MNKMNSKFFLLSLALLLFFGFSSTFANLETNKTVVLGDNLMLSVNVKGSGPIYLQWYKDEVEIPGETSGTLCIKNVKFEDTGNYYCIASNQCGGTKSNICEVKVEFPPFKEKDRNPIMAEEAFAGDFFLWQSEPNPSTDIVRIKFMVPKETNVRLILTDMLGREIAMLQDGILSQGFHQVEINTNDYNLTAGTYLYTLISQGFRETKSMMVVK